MILVVFNDMCIWGEERILQHSAGCARPSAQHSETGENAETDCFSGCLWDRKGSAVLL